MKALLLLVITSALTSCSSSGIRMARDAQQQSLSSGILSEKIKSEIANSENKNTAGCKSPNIRRVALQSSSRGGSGNIIAAREDWIVDRCGIDVIYQVDYYGPIGDSTNIHVKKLTR